jgi:hypothetical protein
MRRLALAFLFLVSGAGAQTLPAEDLRTVYTELAQTHDGFLYTVHMAGYSSEQAARRIWEELQQPRMRAVRMDQFLSNVAPRTAYLFAFDPQVRERLVTLHNGGRAGPIRTPRSWVIVELVGTRPAPVPSFESVQADIPGLVAAGALPSAERLRTDPDLRKRSAANAVRTLADLRKAPADLDVNRLLSTGETLLIRSMLARKDDLAGELLRRGADPNACAYKFCPLHLAIFRGDRGLVTRLIDAGARIEARSALEAAERAGNAEFTAWLKEVLQKKVKGT